MTNGNDPINDLILESGLDPSDLAGVVDVLGSVRGLVPEQAPVPSRELAALIARGAVPPPASLARHRASRPRASVVTAAVAATVALGTGVAAASNTLPVPAQRMLSQLSDKILPFHIPSPEERGDGWRPDDDPFSQQAPGQRKGATAQGTNGAGAKPARDSRDPAVVDAVEPGDVTAPTEPAPSAPPSEGADAQGEQAVAQDEQPAQPDGDLSAGPSSGDNTGRGKGRGVVTPPKGKPTAPPGQGQIDNIQDPPSDPPDSQKAAASAATKGDQQTGKASTADE